MKKSMVLLATVALLVALLASAGYAVRDTHVMKHWHPMFVEPALGYFGLSFFEHDHTRHVHKVEDGAFVGGAPITSCWNYDFLERDCDGPDHFKAFAAGSKIGAYKGDPTPVAPLRAKACAVTTDRREVCVSDWRDDGKTVWRDVPGRIEEHTLAIGCPGPRLEYPCRSKDP